MISVKGGTQTWSKSEQVSALKPDTAQTMSPADMERALGGQNLGEVLNKVADPNWVDPAKTHRTGNPELDKDAFLKLMLTQMKYQDPTNPMQSHEMASQLAQFTSLEQLNNINGTLTSMKTAQAPTTNYQALNFIGKKVAGDSSKVFRVAGDKAHDFTFQLNGDASEAKIIVKDAAGNTVRTLAARDLKKGQNVISWNGVDEDGAAARPGEYRFTFEGKSSNGAKVFAQSDFDGKITGLNFTPQGPVLLVGNQTVRLQDVKKIYEPSAEEKMLEQAPLTPLEAVPAASDDTPVKGDITKAVGLSRGMMNKLSKETGKG